MARCEKHRVCMMVVLGRYAYSFPAAKEITWCMDYCTVVNKNYF